MKKLSHEDFVSRSNKSHSLKYDYSQAIYRNQDTKVKIICPTHGEFWQRPADHMSGAAGCPDCGKINRAANRRRWTKERFLEEAHRIHDNKFEYDLSNFSGFNGNIKFKCENHGWKTIKMSLHVWRGIGCAKCSGKAKRTVEEFIAEACGQHGDRYDYSKAVYKNGHTPVIITCRLHGDFKQAPLNHARNGQGCPHCAAYGQSKLEIEWLDGLGVEMRQVRRDGYCFDGYDPTTNTVYEFHGDFWHGNPALHHPNEINRVNGKSFGDLYQVTKEREHKIKALGYNLIVMWENDYRQNLIKSSKSLL